MEKSHNVRRNFSFCIFFPAQPFVTLPLAHPNTSIGPKHSAIPILNTIFIFPSIFGSIGKGESALAMLLAIRIFPYILGSVRPIGRALAMFCILFEFANVFCSVRPQIDAETGVPLHGGKAAALVT